MNKTDAGRNDTLKLGRLRIVAILATFNEARFIAGSIEHLREQGVDVHLIDNESTDATVAIAERYVGAGVIGIETLPRAGASDLYARLMRKEELAQTLDADWLMHVDADEFHIAAAPRRSLAQAFAEADAAGSMRSTSSSTRSSRRASTPTTTIPTLRERCATTTPSCPGSRTG